EANLRTLVTRVEDEAVRVYDGGGPEVLAVRPEHGAARGARGTEDALRGVVEAGTLGRALGALLAGRGCVRRHEERLHLLEAVEERLHVDDEVLLQGQALERLDVDRLGDVEILDQRLAGQAVA